MFLCTRGGKWAGMMPAPKEGSAGSNWAGSKVKPPRFSQRNGLYVPSPRSQLLGSWAPQTLGRNLLLIPLTPSPTEGEALGRYPSFPVIPFMLPHPDDLGHHSHGPNVWESHYPSPWCSGERATMQSIGPYVGHSLGHALTISFSRPISIWAKGIPEPWYWV